MPNIRVSTMIDAPPDRVFAAAADLRNAAETIDDIISIEVLTDGPIGEGTRWRETRKMFGKEATEEMQISRFDPPNGYDVDAASHGCQYHTEIRCTPVDNKTELSMDFGATAVSFGAKVMGAVMMPMMKKTLVKCLQRDLDCIKRSVESQQPA